MKTQDRPWTQEEIDFMVSCLTADPPWTAASVGERIGRSIHAVRLQWRRYKSMNPGVDVPGLTLMAMGDEKRSQVSVERPVTANRPLEDLLEDLQSEHRRKAGHHKAKHEGIRINVSGSGPYMLALIGDPHIGDPGCDFEGLRDTMVACTLEEDVFMVNMGDITNNWVGRLRELYGYQLATIDEEAALLEWMIGTFPWMLVILGNHDKWGPVAELVCARHGVPAVSHGGKFLVNRDGHTLRAEFRHKMRGGSMYHPHHGSSVRNFKGSNAHLIVGADTHRGGYSVSGNPVTGQMSLCANVSSWKRHDEYADRLGLDPDPTPPVLYVVVDTSVEEGAGVTEQFHDWGHAKTFLRALRERDGQKQA